jgi:restriction endonuclease S subunit
LRFSDLNTFDVAYPEIDEQKEIVAFLDRETAKIDEMVAKKQKMMELLKEKRQALITNAVTKGLYPKVKMKPSGIDWLGDIPDEWEVKRLNYLISNIVDKAADTSENNFIVALENLESWTGNLLSPKDQKLPEGDLKTFSEGDVLFGKLRPYLAKALLAEQKGLCVGEALVFRTKKELLNKFLIYRILTKEFINYIDSSTQGAKMPRAEWEFIKTLQIAYPSIENQKRIVDHIERETARIDEMMKKVEMQIEKLQEYRQALITSAVTGKIMVN